MGGWDTDDGIVVPRPARVGVKLCLHMAPRRARACVGGWAEARGLASGGRNAERCAPQGHIHLSVSTPPCPLRPPRKSPNPCVPFAMATRRGISLTAALLLCARSGSAFGVLDVCALEARSIDPATAACWRGGEGRRRRRRGRWRRRRWRRMRRCDHPAGSHDLPD
eukprot:COSAG01_NODE_2581_length_7412_cov_9.886857_7_plen_166_part_00